MEIKSLSAMKTYVGKTSVIIFIVYCIALVYAVRTNATDLQMVLGVLTPILVVVLMASLVYSAAIHKRQFTFVPQNATEFVAAGNKEGEASSYRRSITNVAGYHMEPTLGWFHGKNDTFTPLEYSESHPLFSTNRSEWERLRQQEHRTMIGAGYVLVKDAIVRNGPDYRDPTHPLAQWLKNYFGIYYVSILWPNNYIHPFKVTKVRMKAAVDPTAKITTLADWATGDTNPVEVTNLRWRFTRALIIEDVEFTDQLRANFAVVIVVQTIMPTIPVWQFPNEFMALLLSHIQAIFIDIGKWRKLKDFIATTKLGPGSDFFPKNIEPKNLPTEDNPTGGLIPKYGFKITGGFIAGVESSDDNTRKALEAMELETLFAEAKLKRTEIEAKAIIAKATGESEEIKLKGDAEAKALKAQKEAVGDEHLGGWLDVLKLKAAGGNVTTYVEGAPAGIMVNAGKPEPKPATPATETKEAGKDKGKETKKNKKET